MNEHNVKEMEGPFEQQLRQMPLIEDKRSKDVVFQQLQQRMNNTPTVKRKNVKWVIPSIASVAALFLLVILVPQFLNGGEGEADFVTMEQIKEDYDQGNMQNEIYSAGVAESAVELEQSSGVEYLEVIRQEELAADERVYGIALTVVTELGTYSIPVSIVGSADNRLEQVRDLIDQFEPKAVGLDESKLKGMTIEEVNKNTVRLMIPDDMLLGGSSGQEEAIIQAAEHTFSDLGYGTLIVETVSGEDLGNYTSGSKLSLLDKKYGYQVFTTEQDYMVLVPMFFEEFDVGSFEQALQKMDVSWEEDMKSVFQVAEVEVPEVQVTEKGPAIVTFQEGTVLSDVNEHIALVDAILLTARYYGITEVQFENAGIDFVGDYDMTSPISTEIYSNGFIEGN